jgi:hypothetical protein
VIGKRLGKSILFIAFCFVNALLFAQEDDCAFYLETIKKWRYKTIHTSSYPLNFEVSENLTMALRFSDRGTKGINLIVTFTDKEGYPVELGNILTFQFEDGSHSAYISQSKRLSTSTVTFPVWRAPAAELPPAIHNEALCAKLCQVNITELSLTADYEVKRIRVLQTQAEIMKTIMQCLVQKASSD